ncbi:MAG: cation:proton antiporter [Balneolaceae bacterium]
MNDRFDISLPFTDPVLIFALVMLIILLAPIAVKKLRIPGIVGLILSGTIVGPSVLGLLERDFTIELLGTVGLLYLMFMAGLSIDLNRFEKLRNKSIQFGLISFFIPQFLALLAGVYLLEYSVATSLLLGSIVGSHTLLAYPIAERLGITKNTAVTMSMGGTLVTDTLSLGILAMVAGSAGESSGAGYWTGFGVSVLLFTVAALVILPRLGRWFFRNIKYENNTDFVFMVAVLFSTAWLAGLAGLAPIIGAFMAGLLLNRLVPESGTLMSRIQFVGNALFIPFFLISVGMLVDVAVLDSRDVWSKAFIFTSLVFAGKGLASFLITRFSELSNAEGWVIYGMTVPQSAATLAVTLIGYELGFFNTTAVNAVVIMILLTCFIGPWLVEAYGRKVAVEEEKKPYEPSEAPQRILVPLANPETSDALMDIAFMVRDKNSDQPVFPLTVARDGRDVEAQVARGESMLSHAVIHAAAAEVPVNPTTSIDLNIAKGIARTVSEKRISNVIIGWNGEISTRRRIFGTILDQLLEELDEMLMVSKLEKPVNTFARIVVAIPPFAALEMGFPGAIRSLKLMAEQIGGDMVVVSTEERSPYVRKQIDNVKPDIGIDYEEINLWSNLPSWFEENRKDDDLFVLISARERTLSWRPALDRLPRVLAQKYPLLSFITVYPSEVEITGEGEKGKLRFLRENRITTGFKSTGLGDILSEIVENGNDFKNADTRRITRRLLENTSGYSPEVMPGVILFESHTSLVNEQMLFIGINRKGVNVEQTASRVHIILVLLSPKELSPEEHLKAINTIVKLIKPGKGFEKIKKSESAKEIFRYLMTVYNS